MKKSHQFGWFFGLLTILVPANFGFAQDVPPKGEALPPNAIEVLTRGPVHEAFAQPIDVKPEPGAVIPKEPPPMLPEVPPEQKPDADNTQWIPGYWAWDSDKQDYIWISGVYRVAPQGRKYVPGYWSNTADGWRWIPGLWANANQKEIPYTPEPPVALATGPAQSPPDDNSMYVPGEWLWQQDRFSWRPGYWAPYQTGRVWVPPQYSWTPNGYLYNDGYWDYPLQNRGLMFAPVYFNQPLWQNAGWSYQPSYVLGFNGLLNNGFVFGPSFYFGNYYAPNYARNGFRPWYSGSGRYDPMFAYHGWQNSRNNPNWFGGVQQHFAGISAGRIAGPPMTFAQQQNSTRIVTPLHQFTSNQVRLVNVTSPQRATQQAMAQKTRQLATHRQQFDARSVGASLHSPGGQGLHFGASNGSAGAQIINRTPNTHTMGTTVNHPSYAYPHITNATPHSTAFQSRGVSAMPSYRLNSNPTMAHPGQPYYRSTNSTMPHVVHSAPAYHAPAFHAPAHVGGGMSHGGGHRR